MNEETLHEEQPDQPGQDTRSQLPPPYVPPGAAPTEPRPPLRRSTSDRMVGGVAAGLARTFGVDPVVFRVVFAALTVIGGSGLILYLLLWAFVPEEGDDDSSIGDRWVRSRSWSTITVLLLALAITVVASIVIGLDSAPLILLGIIAFAALIFSRRDQRPPKTPSPEYPAASAYPAPNAEAAVTPPLYAGYSGQPYAEPAPAAQPYSATKPYSSASLYPPTHPADPPAAPSAPAPPPPPRKPRDRSALGILSLGAAAVVGGVLTAIRLASSDSTPSTTTILAGTTLVLGLGLLLGTFVGRARWLVIPGVALLLLTSASGALHRWDGPTGRQTIQPQSISEVASSYEWRAGELVLDLTDVSGDPDLTIAADLGVGSLRVIVPRNAELAGAAHVRLGSIRTSDGAEYDGWNNLADLEDAPVGAAPSRSKPSVTAQTITLDLTVGIGEVVVSRA